MDEKIISKSLEKYPALLINPDQELKHFALELQKKNIYFSIGSPYYYGANFDKWPEFLSSNEYKYKKQRLLFIRRMYEYFTPDTIKNKNKHNTYKRQIFSINLDNIKADSKEKLYSYIIKAPKSYAYVLPIITNTIQSFIEATFGESVIFKKIKKSVSKNYIILKCNIVVRNKYLFILDQKYFINILKHFSSIVLKAEEKKLLKLFTRPSGIKNRIGDFIEKNLIILNPPYNDNAIKNIVKNFPYPFNLTKIKISFRNILNRPFMNSEEIISEIYYQTDIYLDVSQVFKILKKIYPIIKYQEEDITVWASNQIRDTPAWYKDGYYYRIYLNKIQNFLKKFYKENYDMDINVFQKDSMCSVFTNMSIKPYSITDEGNRILHIKIGTELSIPDFTRYSKDMLELEFQRFKKEIMEWKPIYRKMVEEAVNSSVDLLMLGIMNFCDYGTISNNNRAMKKMNEMVETLIKRAKNNSFTKEILKRTCYRQRYNRCGDELKRWKRLVNLKTPTYKRSRD